MASDGYWFTSSKFAIEPGEDAEINPGIYGRQLARWLKARLDERGYAAVDIVNEDWGRCLMCQRDPFMLWVGCANVTNDETSKDAIVRHCFANAEVLFWKRLFRTIDTESALMKLDRDLGDILRAEPDIALVPEP